MTHSTNTRRTLIEPAEDCPAAMAEVPRKPGTVAAIGHALLAGAPFTLTADDLLHETHLQRGGTKSRAEFFAAPQACLRASPLVKRHGWGIVSDAEGRVALVARESAEFAALQQDCAITKVRGMRNSRGA